MPTNKHAVIRFNVLDKCLRNSGRRFSFEDLKSAVEIQLGEIDQQSSGISVRSLRNDLSFMKSEEGYNAPIDVYKEGKRYFYRYADPNFSINQMPLSDTDAEKLKSAISVLQRFEGSPEFEWIEEVGLMLKDHFGFADDTRKIIGHDNNVDYSGYKFISPIFNAISNKRVIDVRFESFKGDVYEYKFHPYYLKQFNNRWFVFGYNEKENIAQWNTPLDRIVSIQETSIDYRKDETDWEDYFYDIIGVTKPNNKAVEEIQLRFSSYRAPYVITKPLHPSQKAPIFNEDGKVDIRLQVVLNPELVAQILSYGKSVEVIRPETLRLEVISIIKEMTDCYS